MNDSDFLRKAVEIGNQVATPYNFGAVVVKEGKIIAAEHNHVQEMSDPSLHSEVSAIAKACKKLGTHHIDGAVLYASHEPCVMCFSCAAWAHIDRIVYATSAKEQDEFMYEFKDVSLEDLSQKLLRPMTIEHMPIGSNEPRH